MTPFSKLILTLFSTLPIAACAAGDVSPESEPADGRDSELAAADPGWPPTVSAANPGWMPKGAGNPRRSTPSTFVTTWTENGVQKKRQLLSFSNHADGAADNPNTPIDERTSMQLLWRDLGDTGDWQLARKRVGTTIDWSKGLHDTEPGAGASFANIHEKNDAQHTLVIISARPVRINNQWHLVRHESADHGISWEMSYAPLVLPQGLAAAIVHQGITAVEVNGVETLLAPMYFRNYDSYYRMTQMVIQSTDSGKNWSYHGTMAEQQPWCPGLKGVKGVVIMPGIRDPGEPLPPKANGFGEATIAKTRSGKLLAVVRCEQWFSNPTTPSTYHVRSYLNKTTSSNGGVDWSEPAPLAIPNAASGPVSGLPSYGASPKLVPMAGGSLMLAFGRPGNILAFDEAGEGEHWETFAGWPNSNRWDNAPAVDGLAPDGVHLWSHVGSSGYMGVAKLSERQFMVVGDNCQADWGCQYTPPAGASYPHGKDYLLWNLLVSNIPK